MVVGLFIGIEIFTFYSIIFATIFFLYLFAILESPYWNENAIKSIFRSTKSKANQKSRFPHKI
jgi:uncharacterized membrane protein